MNFRKLLFFLIIFISIFINCRVNAKYENEYDNELILSEIKTNETLYDYDIIWDNMQFVYTESKSFEYNDESHDYDMIIEEYWSNDDNKVSISNNSLSNINVSLLYKSNNLYENVIGEFNPSEFTLKYQEKIESSLELNGKINKNEDKLFTIGTITIEVK